ncbi:MAG: alpha/beta hydrolase [Sulfuritalea sp.]|nr:alpha/beta hydrolase [Sulfuritalea sp.]
MTGAKRIAGALAALMVPFAAWGQVDSEIKVGDTVVSATSMGSGEHVVIALHGAGGNTKSFFFGDNGAQFAQGLAQAGFRVIAVTWSGQAGGGFAEVDAAVGHARAIGAKKISLMGHSRGGELAANYARKQPDGTFDTVVQLSSVDDQGLAQTRTKKVFAFNKYDRWANWQPAAFDKSAEPRQLFALGGSGHPVSALVKEQPTLLADLVAILKK